MPNRNCDFCGNGYRTNPMTGYYKLTNKMKDALKVYTMPLDFICGDHFDESCFEPNGRLKATAMPTFFPRKECLDHDHTYTKGNFDLEAEIGKSYLVCKI